MAATRGTDDSYRAKVYREHASVTGLAAPMQMKRDTHAHNLAPHLRLLPRGARVLDIGAGQGECLDVYAALGLDAEGVDISPALVDACTKRGLAVRLIDDLATFLEQSTTTWSMISMIDVIEHFEKQHAMRLLTAIRHRALTKNGMLIVQVPNMQSPFASSNRYIDLTHETGYTENSMIQLLTICGFVDIRLYPQNYPPKGLHLVRGALRSLFYAGVRFVQLVDQPDRGRILTPNLIAIARAP